MKKFITVSLAWTLVLVTGVWLSVALPVGGQGLSASHITLDLTGYASTASPTFTGRVTAGTSVESGYGLHLTAMAKPVNSAFSQGTGILADGTYYYRVSAYNAGGTTDPSIETSFTVSGGPAGVNVVWGAVTGADGYKVYCRSTGAEQLCATITNGATTTWLDDGTVTPAGAMPGYAYGAVFIDVTTNSQNPFMMYYNGSPKCYLNTAGTWYCNSFEADNGWFQTNGNNITLHLQGNATNGASAVGVKSSNAVSLTTDGAEIHTFYSDNETTKRAAITKDGGIQLGVGAGTAPTCDAAHRGIFYYQPGAGGVKDVVQVCAKDASDVYAWRAIY